MSGVQASEVIDAPVEDVWDVVRDFSDITEWHSGLDNCDMRGNGRGDQVGSVRNDYVEDYVFSVKLVELSDLNHFLTYHLVGGPLPVKNYYGTLRLHEITEGDRTLADWSNRYDPLPGPALTEDHKTVMSWAFPERNPDELDPVESVNTLEGTSFQTGFDGLKEMLES